MKKTITTVAALALVATGGSALAMMNGGMMNGGYNGTPGTTTGTMGTPGTTTGTMTPPANVQAGGRQCLGPGYGMAGAGGLRSGMFGATLRQGYLDQLTPLASGQDAVTAVQDFLTTAKSTLQISSVWEYPTVYKVELADANGQLAFDLVADKLTGAVTPEMGFSMMMNASWGKQLQATPRFLRKLTLTADDATAAAQAFVTKNATVINYNLGTPETYPGYYKFHTTDTTGAPGMDIMVNGYSGGIWMNTQLGTPIGQVQ